MRRKVDPITKEKIEFIDSNSYVLNDLLKNRIGNEKRVIDVVASIIISDDKLENCENISELKELIDLNRNLCTPVEKDDSDSYWLIFNVAHYVNFAIVDEELNSSIRDRLRLYASHFKKDRIFSENYHKFVVIGDTKDSLLIKKIGQYKM